jgi:hypothetical protein
MDRRLTLTLDNGREFSGHEKIARLLSLSVYFADPYSSWQRGTNENTNGLLRQYLPKTESFLQLTGWQLSRYVTQLPVEQQTQKVPQLPDSSGSLLVPTRCTWDVNSPPWKAPADAAPAN